jgi:hypothetical protein
MSNDGREHLLHAGLAAARQLLNCQSNSSKQQGLTRAAEWLSLLMLCGN